MSSWRPSAARQRLLQLLRQSGAALLTGAFSGPKTARAADKEESTPEKSDVEKGQDKNQQGEDKEKEDEEAKEEDEEEEGDDDVDPPSVAAWFEDSNHEFSKLESFHTLYIRKDHRQVLLHMNKNKFGLPFFNQVTIIGQEGGLPDMVDCTPESTGFMFRWASNGTDVQLVQMQQQLQDTDLAASLYEPGSGGMLSGYLRVFEPVAVDKHEEQDEKSDSDEKPIAKPQQNTVGNRLYGRAAGTRKVRRPPHNKRSYMQRDTSKEDKQTETEASDADSVAGKSSKKKKKSSKTDPIPVAPSEEAVLLDVTDWLSTFSSAVVPDTVFSEKSDILAPLTGDVPGEACLEQVRAFSSNFWLGYSMLQGSAGPVKKGSETTIYYMVAFCQLPERLMVPRAKDRRVGFFETTVMVGGERRVNEAYSVIRKWNLERLGHLCYYIDPGVPKLYWDTIRLGVESWNSAFKAAGRGEHAVRCVAPGEPDFPSDYSRGDARYNAIYMTDSSMDLLGFGPSLIDFRTGEIIVAHVLLGFSAFVQGASGHSSEVLSEEFVQRTCGCRPPLLDADHPDVLRLVLSTVVHEVGHTLGLRHNFIAQEDGNSSVMAYPDDLDTSKDPHEPVFGGHYLIEPGRYDIFAIKYGYTPLEGEKPGQRHPSLALLANGQEASDSVLASTPLNPLFATDEDLGGEDPRVNLWIARVSNCGYDKLSHALQQRHNMLELVRAGQIFPEEYSRRIRNAYSIVQRHVLASVCFIGGSLLGPDRTNFTHCTVEQSLESLRAVVDFCVGPLGRMSMEEGRFFLGQYPSTDYGICPDWWLSNHKFSIERMLRRVLQPHYLEKLEMQHAMWQESPLPPPDSKEPLSTYTLLAALAFAPGRYAPGLLHPFTAPGAPGSKQEDDWAPPSHAALNRAGSDPLRAEAALAFAKHVHALAHAPSALAIVRMGAQAFIKSALACLKAAEQNRRREPLAEATWAAVVAQLEKEPESVASNPLSLSFLFGKNLDRDDYEQPGRGAMSCGHGMHTGSGRMRQRASRPHPRSPLLQRRGKHLLRGLQGRSVCGCCHQQVGRCSLSKL